MQAALLVAEAGCAALLLVATVRAHARTHACTRARARAHTHTHIQNRWKEMGRECVNLAADTYMLYTKVGDRPAIYYVSRQDGHTTRAPPQRE
jgi:hypothetical protein